MGNVCSDKVIMFQIGILSKIKCTTYDGKILGNNS